MKVGFLPFSLPYYQQQRLEEKRLVQIAEAMIERNRRRIPQPPKKRKTFK